MTRDFVRQRGCSPLRMEPPMELILIILVLVLLFGGGGYWARGRYW
jgi:hypothetical protein